MRSLCGNQARLVKEKDKYRLGKQRAQKEAKYIHPDSDRMHQQSNSRFVERNSKPNHSVDSSVISSLLLVSSLSPAIASSVVLSVGPSLGHVKGS